MKILALDLAQHKIGWATDGPTVCPPAAGVYVTRAKYLSRGAVLLALGNWLHDTVREDEIGMLAYEKPIQGGAPVSGEWAIWKGALAGMVDCVAESCRIPVDSAAPNTWRKHFLGTGRSMKRKEAKRRTMAMCDMLSWDYHGSDDAADAAGVWAWAKANKDPQFRYEAATPMFARAG